MLVLVPEANPEYLGCKVDNNRWKIDYDWLDAEHVCLFSQQFVTFFEHLIFIFFFCQWRKEARNRAKKKIAPDRI